MTEKCRVYLYVYAFICRRERTRTKRSAGSPSHSTLPVFPWVHMTQPYDHTDSYPISNKYSIFLKIYLIKINVARVCFFQIEKFPVE